jgi:hypothetical protein
VMAAPSGENEGFRLERLLPLACLAGAGVLFASELMTTFDLTPPGVDPQCALSAADRHHYAPLVLAVAAIIAVVVVLASGSKPAAISVAACGVLALLIFLVIDLPDANNVGTINDTCGSIEQSFIDAKAVPQVGFWMELLGSLSLAISGLALASLTPDQLIALRPRWLSAPRAKPPAPRRRQPPDRGATGKDLLADAERFGEEIAPNQLSGNDKAAPEPAPEKKGT